MEDSNKYRPGLKADIEVIAVYGGVFRWLFTTFWSVISCCQQLNRCALAVVGLYKTNNARLFQL